MSRQDYFGDCIRCGEEFEYGDSGFFCDKCRLENPKISYCIYCKTIFKDIDYPVLTDCPNGCIVPSENAKLYN
jgi:hypothetical protein